MFSKLEILLKNKSDQKVSINMSSLFQGCLMEMIDSEYAAKIHSMSINPYSQYIQYHEDEVKWIIATLDKESYEQIIVKINDKISDKITLKYNDMEFEVIDKEISSLTGEDMLKSRFFEDYNKYITIRFLTPTSFKSDGRHQNYPTVKWIIQSLMTKADAFDEKNQFYDEVILEKLQNDIIITSYNLRSTKISLEKVKINSFVGSITFCINSSQGLINLVNYLLHVGEYSGVGIKTSMGMGAISVKSSPKNVQPKEGHKEEVTEE